MKALILNSGIGHRMGDLTRHQPKCMTAIAMGDTILGRQLRQLSRYNLEVVVTTGLFHQEIIDYCEGLQLPLDYQFVKNPLYDATNYIYSIYCAREILDDDILLLHGDLVFEDSVLEDVINHVQSCMVTSSTIPLPEKDFKAVLQGERIEKVGIEFFERARGAQPLYKLLKRDWLVWLAQIESYCEGGTRGCYAENAFNEVWESCPIYALDVMDRLCSEVDTPEDLAVVKGLLQKN